VPVSGGHVSAHRVERDRSTPASEEGQEEHEGGPPSERLKRAAHRVYYTTRLDMAQDATVHRCWICGAIMREIKCKIVCPHCGYTRDCSDP
jgi:rubrerythrin